MLARPIEDKDSGKWMVEVNFEGENVRVGHFVIDDITMKYNRWNTKGEAIDWIKSKNNLQLDNN